jgi:hypothetical protein
MKNMSSGNPGTNSAPPYFPCSKNWKLESLKKFQSFDSAEISSEFNLSTS